MSRMPRFLRKNTAAVYHVVSRTALDGFPLGPEERDHLLELITRYAQLFFVDVLGFAIMGNHMHLVCRVYPEESVTEKDVQERYHEFFWTEQNFL